MPHERVAAAAAAPELGTPVRRDFGKGGRSVLARGLSATKLPAAAAAAAPAAGGAAAGGGEEGAALPELWYELFAACIQAGGMASGHYWARPAPNSSVSVPLCASPALLTPPVHPGSRYRCGKEHVKSSLFVTAGGKVA